MLDVSSIYIKQPTDEELLEEAKNSIYCDVTDPNVLRILHVRPEEIRGDIRRRERLAEQDRRIAEQNRQIAEQDRQIAEQDRQISAMKEQITGLYSLLSEHGIVPENSDQ